MVYGVGVDMVKIARLDSWIDSAYRLSKVFTQRELVGYLREIGESFHDEGNEKIRERKASYFAVRFAVKEAFYKAISSALVLMGAKDHLFSLFLVFQNVEVIKQAGVVPTLDVTWATFERKTGKKLSCLTPHISLAHEKGYAIAVVVLSK